MMSENVCPMCGHYINSDYCHHGRRDYVAEIARLRAELEKAEASTDGVWKMYQALITYHSNAIEERDEARKWAWYFYRLCKYGE